MLLKIATKLAQNNPRSRRQHCVTIGICLKIASFGLCILCLMVNDVKTFKEYGMQFEKAVGVERCYVLCWAGACLKKICIGSQSLDQKVPDPELLALAQVVTCFEEEQLPVSILGASPSLICVLDDN